jgi:N-acetylneuraminic acid mutarotase
MWQEAVNTGLIYDSATNQWMSLPTEGAPTPRAGHLAVVTGSKMIIWGGFDVDGNLVSSGGIFDMQTGTWEAVSAENAPSPLHYPVAISIGSKMIVWGGYSYEPINGWRPNLSGSVFDPAENKWTTMSNQNAPVSRFSPAIVGTGSKMIVWGGFDLNTRELLNSGGVYDLESNTWKQITQGIHSYHLIEFIVFNKQNFLTAKVYSFTKF